MAPGGERRQFEGILVETRAGVRRGAFSEGDCDRIQPLETLDYYHYCLYTVYSLWNRLFDDIFGKTCMCPRNLDKFDLEVLNKEKVLKLFGFEQFLQYYFVFV